MKKRTIALLLAILILTSFLQVGVLAATTYIGRTVDKIVLYKKPIAKSENQWVYLGEGMKIEVIAQTNNFYTVIVPSGKRGYVKKSDIKLVSRSTDDVDTVTEPNSNANSSNNTNVTDLAPTTSNNTSDLIDDMLKLVNAERIKAGITPLTSESKLQQAADIRAKELVSKFSHTRPDGSEFGTVLIEVGYNASSSAAENIANGYTSADLAMSAWMASSAHKANIMNSDYTYLAIAKSESNGQVFWVQLFG